MPGVIPRRSTPTADPCGRGLFEKIQGARDIRIDKVLSRVSRDMRLVQSGGVYVRVDALHALLDESAIENGAHAFGKRPGFDVDADCLVR